MISIKGMNLNVDDWHGRSPARFDQLSVIVTGLHRVMNAVTGKAPTSVVSNTAVSHWSI
jgi:hypothetical protein